MDKNISFTLKIWRQAGPKAKGAFETYQMKDIPGDTSFLEMLDILNEQLISRQGTGCIRPRLPRRYLRYVLTLHQRTSARTCTGSNYLPDLHAPLQRWRHYHR